MTKQVAKTVEEVLKQMEEDRSVNVHELQERLASRGLIVEVSTKQEEN